MTLWPEITHVLNLWLSTILQSHQTECRLLWMTAAARHNHPQPSYSVIASVTFFCLDPQRKKNPWNSFSQDKRNPLRHHLKLIHLDGFLVLFSVLCFVFFFFFASIFITSDCFKDFFFFDMLRWATLCLEIHNEGRWCYSRRAWLLRRLTDKWVSAATLWRDELEQRRREPISTQVRIFSCLAKALNGDELIPCAICHLSHMSRTKESERERKKRSAYC